MKGSAHNSTHKILYKNTRHTTLVFMLCCYCRCVAFKSFQNCKYALDNELTRDRNNCKCRAMSSNCKWNSSHISPFRYQSSQNKCTLTCGCLVATDTPAPAHAIMPPSMVLSHPRRTYAVVQEHMVEEQQKKKHRNEIAGVVHIKRMVSVAPQVCTTLATSRKTVRNGSYPENSKRTLQPASTEYDGIGAHTTQNANFPTKKIGPTTLVLVLRYCCRWVASGSSEICACALDNELARDRNNCKCRATSSNCKWSSSHISPFTWEGSWDKCTFTSGCPVATHAPATSHAVTPQAVLSVLSICDKLTVFSNNTCLKNRKNNNIETR